MACWDLFTRVRGEPLAEALGGTRREIHSGVSLGIEPTVEGILEQVEHYLDQGYKRIKMKIGPGQRPGLPAGGARALADVLLMADANSAYSLDNPDARRRAARARRPELDDDRAAAGRRRHRRSRSPAGAAQDADLPGRKHPLGRRRPQSAGPGQLSDHQHQSQPARRPERGAARARPVSGARRSRCGAAACTSSASAGRRTWPSAACPASPCRATCPARTRPTARTSSIRRSARTPAPSRCPWDRPGLGLRRQLRAASKPTPCASSCSKTERAPLHA